MIRKDFPVLAFKLLGDNKWSGHCSLNRLILPLAAVIFLSTFLYLEAFGYTAVHVTTVTGLAGLGLWLAADRRDALLVGAGVGIAWFYWISLSFRYYDLTWAIPFVIAAVGAVYALLFWLIAWLPSVWLRAAAIGLAFDYVAPFGFDWFRPELIFITSDLGTSKPDFIAILAALTLLLEGGRRTTGRPVLRAVVVLIAAGLLLEARAVRHPLAQAPLKILTQRTDTPQDLRWDDRRLPQVIADNDRLIDAAADAGYDLIILPESAYPLVLTDRPELIARLAQKSRRIAIAAGTIRTDRAKRQIFNSAAYFVDGRLTIADKTVLVPFGEAVPLPKPLVTLVNTLFFDGAQDYAVADRPTDIVIKGIAFRNAICYEATTPSLFAGSPAYMIAVSNNAWFTPSVEPTLQRLLMEMFSRRYGTVIYHAVNGSPAGTVR